MSDFMSVPGMMSADEPLTGTGPQIAPQITPEKVIPRDKPDPRAERKALVKQKLKDIKAGEKKHAAAFKRMDEDMDFAYKWGVGEQWEGQTEQDDRYIANVVQRHINQRVAALYAKDPTIVAKPTRRRYFKVWDERFDSLQAAQMALQNAAMSSAAMPGQQPGLAPAAPLMPMAPPQWAIDIMQDFQDGMLRKQMVKNVGETLEIIFRYFMKEMVPDFKESMKQLVRRTEACGVGYVEIGYQRLYGKRTITQSRIADVVDQMQTLDRLRADLLDEEMPENDAELEELKLTLAEMQSEPEVIVREGLVWDFPKSTSIIVDPQCKQLNGWVGARWIAKVIPMTSDDIKEFYGVDICAGEDVSSSETRVLPHAMSKSEDSSEDKIHNVYRLYDRRTGLQYDLTEDWADFLKEPAAPEVRVEQFFPIYPLIFNAIEHKSELFPPSDVRLLRSQQKEYNRIKEALRQHRIANRPLYAMPAGALEDEDKEGQGQLALDNYPAHAVIELQGLAEDQKIGDKIQPVQKVNIDPNLYETEGTFNDIQRVSGSSEANLGGTSKATATESNISEGSRLSSLESNADDLDSLLTRMARDGGQVLLQELSTESAMEIAGEGAVWPELSRGELAKEIYLDIEAGSSGRPNRARDIANFKDMGPLMMQMPGINPESMARYAWRILDDRADLADMLLPGMPSITAMNGMKQVGTGDPATDPNAQGQEGAQNAPAGPPTDGPGAQVPSPAALS